MKNLLLLFPLFALFNCSSSEKPTQQNHEKEKISIDTVVTQVSQQKKKQPLKFQADIDKTFKKENYRVSFFDTIYFPKNYQETHIRLDSIDYLNIFKKSITINESTRYSYSFYFHSLILNTDSIKQITLITWGDGGVEYNELITILPDTTYSLKLAENREEENTYSVIAKDTLTRHFKFTPMVAEWFREDSSTIGYYWDEYEMTITKFSLNSTPPTSLESTSYNQLSNLQFYSPESYGNQYEKEIDSLNNVFKNSSFESYKTLKDTAWYNIKLIEKSR
jgi:hypothetical protein